MKTVILVWVLVVAALCPTVSAQSQPTSGRRAATGGGPAAGSGRLAVDTPAWAADDRDRRIAVLLPAGTVVQIVQASRLWYSFVYRDPKRGVLRGEAWWKDLRAGGEETETDRVGRPSVWQRGTIEARVFGFPQATATDTERVFADTLYRQEVFFRPSAHVRFDTGFDVRANSNSQVGNSSVVDALLDRSRLRPPLALRRLSMSVSGGPLTLDIGKQFVRWGRTDILSPTDRLAPRDYVNVIDSEFLPITAARGVARFGGESVEGVWVPVFTPSRLPLLGQRWTVPPAGLENFGLVDAGASYPTTPQWGVRWTHSGRFDVGVSMFNGFNHLPNLTPSVDIAGKQVSVGRAFTPVRTYGTELALPTAVVTVKGEAAYFESSSPDADQFVLYVLEFERQIGEWTLDAGYAGEVVTDARSSTGVGPERGFARSVIGRAAYTVNPRKTLAIEGAVRQGGDGFYTRAEFSQTFGSHARATIAAVGIGGKPADTIGQFRRNSNVSVSLRLNF